MSEMEFVIVLIILVVHVMVLPFGSDVHDDEEGE